MVNFLNNDTLLLKKGISNVPCPDQIRGYIKDETYYSSCITPCTNFISYVNTNGADGIENKINNLIVILLESPHKNEFQRNNTDLEAKGPAMGATGTLFNKHFVKFFKSSNIYHYLENNKEYHVILVNAIQYQCSCGKTLQSYVNKKTRDENWKYCFEKEELNDLSRRLDAIKPFAIINLCTKGFCNMQLMLYDFLKCRKELYTYGTHPSTWNFSYAKIE